jgi:integrase
LELPSREEFLKFVEVIRSAGARQSKDCANLVCFLAYCGLRIGEAKHVTWADVNFARHQLHVRGDPETATKNGETRYVPTIPELEQLLIELRAARVNEPATATVMRVFECQNSMTHAAAKIGIKRITHHDLRHLFATICIESVLPKLQTRLRSSSPAHLPMKTRLQKRGKIAKSERKLRKRPLIYALVRQCSQQ